MTSSIKHIESEIADLRQDIDLIKNVLNEDFELSEKANKALAKARKTDESKYINLE